MDISGNYEKGKKMSCPGSCPTKIEKAFEARGPRPTNRDALYLIRCLDGARMRRSAG